MNCGSSLPTWAHSKCNDWPGISVAAPIVGLTTMVEESAKCLRVRLIVRSNLVKLMIIFLQSLPSSLGRPKRVDSSTWIMFSFLFSSLLSVFFKLPLFFQKHMKIMCPKLGSSVTVLGQWMQKFHWKWGTQRCGRACGNDEVRKYCKRNNNARHIMVQNWQ